jgi:hypothetical protein
MSGVVISKLRREEDKASVAGQVLPCTCDGVQVVAWPPVSGGLHTACTVRAEGKPALSSDPSTQRGLANSKAWLGVVSSTVGHQILLRHPYHRRHERFFKFKLGMYLGRPILVVYGAVVRAFAFHPSWTDSAPHRFPSRQNGPPTPSIGRQWRQAAGHASRTKSLEYK